MFLVFGGSSNKCLNFLQDCLGAKPQSSMDSQTSQTVKTKFDRGSHQGSL